MLVRNALFITAFAGVFLTAVSETQVQKLGVKNDDPVPAPSSAVVDPLSPEGRSLFSGTTSIFRRISNFFGFGGREKKTGHRRQPFRQRQELGPSEFIYSISENRRRDGEKVIAKRKNLAYPRPPPPRAKNTYAKNGYEDFEGAASSYGSPSKFYESYGSISPRGNSRRKGLKKEVVLKNSAKFEEGSVKKRMKGHEPSVSYSRVVSFPSMFEPNKVKNQFVSNDKVQNIKKKEETHSKFAIKKFVYDYDSSVEQEASNRKEPAYYSKPAKVIKSTPDRYYAKKEKKRYEKPNVLRLHKKPHPYPFESTKPIYRDTLYDDYDDPLLAQGHGPKPTYASPPNRGSYYKEEEQKGLLDNVTSFASNFFSNFLPKSPSTLRSLKRRYRQPPKRQMFPPQATLPRSSSFRAASLSSRSALSGGDSRHGRFDPSPQQGTIADDSFQPIFVPSHSMDSKLPTDIMKPLIIPEKRTAQLVDPTASKPELIDFF